MKISHESCQELINKTIYADEFEQSQEIQESHSNNRIFGTKQQIFKFSPDISGLKYEYTCYQALLESAWFPGPMAYVTTGQ